MILLIIHSFWKANGGKTKMKRRKLHSSLLNRVKLKSMAIPEEGGWRKVEIYKRNSSINFNGRNVTITSGTACIAIRSQYF
ncbi:hypothetical protein KJ575_03195 [Patescibacteria group bacterium]|nr:hypothetical protein [Patescibacteria group bacterium]